MRTSDDTIAMNIGRILRFALSSSMSWCTSALALLLMQNAMAQTGCEMPPPPPPSEELGLACGQTISYAPLIPAHTPIKTLRIAFHLFQNDDGSGNFARMIPRTWNT